jgi:alkylation response protein AidB-like acyl-CoA dehydrogenase
MRSITPISCAAVAAQLTGLTERALELTLDHLRTRQQFDRPIGSFQALQHRAVDLWIQKELARTTLEASLKTFADPAAGLAARETAASSAKARASAAARLVAGQAVQLHGAIGFTDEHELGLHVNRALTLSAWLGNAAEHRRRFADRVVPSATEEG